MRDPAALDDPRSSSERAPWRFALVVGAAVTLGFVGVSLLGGVRGVPLLGSAAVVLALAALAGRWIARGDARRARESREAMGGPVRVERRRGA